MKKILLINCYFGTYPDYFELFLDSCKNNKSIDFLLFTDCKIEEVPKNVQIIYINFEELKIKIQKKFDFQITLNTPYKLCDYKPAYGYIFEENIKGYDFWGYCDIDLLFGDLRKFLTEEILDNYEKIYQLGHLTMYKNTPENNRRFMLPGQPEYKEAFTTNVITVFDETFGVQRKYEKAGISTYKKRDYADISPRFHRFRLSDYFVDISKKENNFHHQIFVYEQGKVYRYYLVKNMIQKDEFAYIHFQKREMPRLGDVKDCFYVTNEGFISKSNSDEISAKQIKLLNRFILRKEIKVKTYYTIWKIKRKINKMRKLGT